SRSRVAATARREPWRALVVGPRDRDLRLVTAKRLAHLPLACFYAAPGGNTGGLEYGLVER
ncbi:MAG TPA: hypothetical protein PLW65_22500, partial [Pseudomonadota bacterium]|nr:hypothetical protein [Pseudomonadota bacterium]